MLHLRQSLIINLLQAEKTSVNLVVRSLNLVERLFEHRAWAAEVHSHEARALLAEHCAVVHANLCLADEELNELVVWQAKAACIKEDKERCLWANHTHLWHVILKILLHIVDVCLNIFKHLLNPLLALLVCSSHRPSGEYVRGVELALAQEFVVLLSDFGVLDYVVRALKTCNVESLARSHKGDAAVLCILTHACERCVLVALECHVAVNLVTDDEHIVLNADVAHMLQLLL